VRYLIIISFFLIIISQGCTHTTESQGNFPIIWGKSIEGVSIGDDSTTVVRKLGNPTAIQWGDFDGYIFYYDAGSKYNRMEILIVKGHALNLGVISMQVYSPYKGTTKDGIGIGITREKTISILGQPDKTSTGPGGLLNIIDEYDFTKCSFSLEFRDGVVYVILMSVTTLKQ